MIDKFKRLCEGFTFVNSWDDLEITPETFWIYAINVAAKETSHTFIYSVDKLHSKIYRNKRILINLQQRMYYNQECSPASSNISTFLDQKSNEQETVCFYKGAIYQCTYNQDGVFRHSQLSLCYDLPQKIDLDIFWMIKMLVSPLTIKYDASVFDPGLPKYHYIQLGFKEVSIGKATEHILTNMIWIAYDISMYYAIMSLGIFLIQWVTHTLAW